MLLKGDCVVSVALTAMEVVLLKLSLYLSLRTLRNLLWEYLRSNRIKLDPCHLSGILNKFKIPLQLKKTIKI